MTETAKEPMDEEIARLAYEELVIEHPGYAALPEPMAKALIRLGVNNGIRFSTLTTDILSVEKLQEELESCIQTLITISILANGDENIVIGNFVDSRLSKLAKNHENVTKYIEKVTGKNIDVVLAENTALEVEEEDND